MSISLDSVQGGKLTQDNFQSALGQELLRRYRSSSLFTRSFLRLRWRLTPYEQIAACLPTAGLILDLGAGHGLLSLTLARQAPQRYVLGLDHDVERVASARRAGRGLPNVAFEVGSLTTALDAPVQQPAGIVVMDALHYLSAREQDLLLQKAAAILPPAGVFVLREVDTCAGFTSWFNRRYERLMTGLGFTRAGLLHFRTPQQWHAQLQRCGFTVASEPCGRFPFADRLFVCQKG